MTKMPTIISQHGKPSIRQLAKHLRQDVISRNLYEGDRYLSTAQVSTMLGISASKAHRALKLLVDEKLLVRQPNSGTYVGPEAGVRKATTLRTVYTLVASSYTSQSFRFDLMVQGICTELKGVNVQLNFMPEREELEYVLRLLEFAQSVGEVVGVVPMSCPRNIYRYLAELGLPSVVMGTLYSGDPVLPSLDMDNFEAGRLLARYMIDNGHSRIAFLTSPQLQQGDNDRLAGISNVLTDAKLPHDALCFQAVPLTPPTLSASVRDLLFTHNPPTAFLVPGEDAANVVASVAEESHLNSTRKIEIAYFDHASITGEHSSYAHVQPQLNFREFGVMAGRMLKQQSDGGSEHAKRVIIPVVLRRPNRANT